MDWSMLLGLIQTDPFSAGTMAVVVFAAIRQEWTTREHRLFAREIRWRTSRLEKHLGLYQGDER